MVEVVGARGLSGKVFKVSTSDHKYMDSCTVKY